MADNKTLSARFQWPKLKASGAIGALLVLIGLLAAFLELVVFDMRRPEWTVALLGAGLFALFFSVCFDLGYFFCQLVLRSFRWLWARLSD